MMYEDQLARGQLLLDQGRPELAIEHYQAALALEPEEPDVYIGLAMCSLELDDLDAAANYAHTLLGLDPYEPLAHMVLGRVALRSRKPKVARQHAESMLELAPTSSSAEGLIAESWAQQKQWRKTIEAAERGLSLHADDDYCLNLRSLALAQLGRHDEAQADIDESLRRDADDPSTHANAGWGKLRRGDHREARRHFQEALRLQPSNEWARSGLLESIKSSNVIYRFLFRAMLWMSSIPTGKFFIIMIATVFLRRYLNNLGEGNPVMAIVADVVTYGIFSFFVATMLLVPFGNLIILLHPLGRYALKGREIFQAALLGILLLLLLATVLTLTFAGFGWWALSLTMIGALACWAASLAADPDRLVWWSRSILILLGVTFVSLTVATTTIEVMRVGHLRQVDSAFMEVGLPPWTEMNEDTMATPEQAKVAKKEIAQFNERKSLYSIGALLSQLGIWGLVAMTWLSGFIYRQAPE